MADLIASEHKSNMRGAVDTTSSKPQPKQLTSYDRAALATEAVELRIARVRKYLAPFNASAINKHGFYAEPFERRHDLTEAGNEIKQAINIILNNCWPDEDEDAVAKALAVHPQLERLRQHCTHTIRDLIQSLRTIEKTINEDEDSPRRFAEIQHGFREIKKQIEAIDCIVYDRFMVSKSGGLQ